jgi:hypothetical protein
MTLRFPLRPWSSEKEPSLTDWTGPIERLTARRDWPRRTIDVIVIGNPDGQLDMIRIVDPLLEVTTIPIRR